MQAEGIDGDRPDFSSDDQNGMPRPPLLNLLCRGDLGPRAKVREKLRAQFLDVGRNACNLGQKSMRFHVAQDRSLSAPSTPVPNLIYSSVWTALWIAQSICPRSYMTKSVCRPWIEPESYCGFVPELAELSTRNPKDLLSWFGSVPCLQKEVGNSFTIRTYPLSWTTLGGLSPSKHTQQHSDTAQIRLGQR